MAASTAVRLTLETGLRRRQENFTFTRVIVRSFSRQDPVQAGTRLDGPDGADTARPVSTPSFYQVGVNLLTTSDDIQVVGDMACGTAGYVLIRHADEFWIGIGSDHTDRTVESFSMTISKQCCPKPFGPTVWRYADVKGHWKALILRSYRHIGGDCILHQENSATTMIEPMELAAQYAVVHRPLTPGQAIFGGSSPFNRNPTDVSRFEIELEDPILGRKLSHVYNVEMLPNTQ